MTFRTILLLGFLGAGLFSVGCKNKKKLRDDEALEAVVAADRQLMLKEEEIASHRGALQRERKKISDRRAELLTKKAALQESDAQGREALEAEETKLAGLEASLVQQEIDLNQKLQNLFDEKSGLMKKIMNKKSSTAREMLIGRREYSVALREKDVARRESELSRREKALALREQAFAKRQATLCPKGATSVQVIQPSSGHGGGKTPSFSRRDVEPVFQAALNAMRTKGILTADLPPGIDRLITEVRHGVGKGDFVRAKYAADQLLATVRNMKIDRAFIGEKINRLSAVIRRAKPTRATRAKVDRLFQGATANYGDGSFLEANRKLNRIYDLLH